MVSVKIYIYLLYIYYIFWIMLGEHAALAIIIENIWMIMGPQYIKLLLMHHPKP